MKKLAFSSRNPQNISMRRLGSERGVILLLACFSMPVLVSLLGIGIDLSIMYSIKAKLQMACDGAAVAALRSLSLAQDQVSQQAVAQTIATQWFSANFAGDFLGATGTTVPVVTVTEQATTRSVAISANTLAPTYFMKYWGRAATPVGATSQTSRRDVAVMLVLDRSGSMNSTNNTYNGMTPCDVMKMAAKQFTGMFQQGRDRIGLATFATTVQIVQSPTTNFQTSLGYSNSAGSSSGVLDGITCGNYTNTSTAISLGWNELYKLQLPGALNILVLFTDGTPTAATYDFAPAIVAAGGCVTPANWVAYRQANSGGGALSFGPASFFPGVAGMVGSIVQNGLNANGIGTFYSPAGADPVDILYTGNDAPGCSYSVSQSGVLGSDIAFIPQQDKWGNPSTGYRTNIPSSNIPVDGNTLGDVVFNLADNAANFARSPHVYSNGVAMAGTLINTIGLGGNGGVDFTLLQRMANDQHGDLSVPYPDYPGYNPSQPQGQFQYSSDASQLSGVFTKLASQILRISR